MRKNACIGLLALLVAGACASGTSRTGEPGLFRIDVERVARDDGRASLRVTVRNDSDDSLEVLDYTVRPIEGESAFEALDTRGPLLLGPGEEAKSSFALGVGEMLPTRVAVDVTWRRGEGPMERRSFWADLQ